MAQQKTWETAYHDPGDLRREMLEGHGGKIANMLVGLIINSNDAYERAGIEKPRRIRIEIDKTKPKVVKDQRGKARVRVIDWAEGMDYEDFGRNFQSYAGQKSKWESGKKISGLFGREASDIMWSNVHSNYLCLKGDKGYVCEFRPPLDFHRNILDRRAAQRLREDYNGKTALTVAEFYLNEQWALPSFNALANTLRNHFRLRLINQNRNTKISLVYIQQTGKKKNETVIDFEPLEVEGEGADLIDEHPFKMKYKDYPEFNAKATLYKKRGRDLVQSGTDREGGLLICADDQTVIDLSLFGFDEAAYIAYNRRFFGYVQINVADIIRSELRNASQKLALIELDRSGLRKRTEFCDTLKRLLDDWMRPYIESEQASISSRSTQSLTSNWNRKLKPLWAEINRVISDKTGKEGRIVKGKGTPPNTLAFARDKIRPSEGATYRIELLFNTLAIKPETPFMITCDNPHIQVSPQSGIVPMPNHPDLPKIARHTITIRANVADEEATVEAFVPEFDPAVLHVSSVDCDVHIPTDGIEWWPNEFGAAEGEISHPTLWIDLTHEQASADISIRSLDEFIEVHDASIDMGQLNVIKDDPARGIKVGRIRPRIEAHGIDNQGTVFAGMGSCNDVLQVTVVDKKITRPPGWWSFSGFDWVAHPSTDIDLYSSLKGEICFNVNHPLVAGYFGSNKDDAPTHVAKDPGLQRLAAHMIVDFILNDLSQKAWRNEDSANPNLEIGTRDRNIMDIQVYNYVMKLKGTHGKDWVERIAEALSG